jgi:hypothetical protein
MKDYKEKYLKYRNKYLNLKNTKIKQTGGTIQDIFQYLEENMGKIDPNHFDIIQLHAYSYMDDMPYITLEEFIFDVKELYDINLPRPRQMYARSPPMAAARTQSMAAARSQSMAMAAAKSQSMAIAAARSPPRSPPRPMAMAAAMDRLSLYEPASTTMAKQSCLVRNTSTPSIDAIREPIDGSLITVYTTGLNYFERSPHEGHVKALIDNIVDTCYRAGKRVKFIHYDMFKNLSPRYYRDEIFINGYLTIEIIRAKIENNRNALLLDCAHVIRYFRNPNPHIMKPIIKLTYYDYSANITLNNINCFYPGFLGDMDIGNTDYVKNFKFFQFDYDNNIITFIEKGIEKNIKIRENDMGTIDTFIDFTGEQEKYGHRKINNEIEIYGRVANVRSSQELNILFWE